MTFVPRLLLSLIVCVAAQAGTVTFSDTTFANSDWDESPIYDTHGTFSFSASQSGGTRFTQHNWTAGQVTLGHYNLLAVYNPSVGGAITSLEYSFRANYTGPGNPGGVGLQFVALQDGVAYGALYHVATSSGFDTITQSGLTASDFKRIQVAVPSTVSPDFSTSGSAIVFGYATQNGTAFPGSFSTTHAVDDWTVTFQTGLAPVPEPTTFMLAGFALAALTKCRRHV